MKLSKVLGLCFVVCCFSTYLVGQPLMGTRILAWVKYADLFDEWAKTKKLLSAWGAEVMETETETPDEFLSLLKDADVLLIPEQEDGYEVDIVAAGQKLSPAIKAFLRAGGRIVSLDFANGGVDVLRGAGLTTANDGSTVTGEMLEVLIPDDPLVQGVVRTFKAPDGTHSYYKVDTDAQIIVAKGEAPVVFRLLREGGEIVFLGFDFYRSNEATEAILRNACQAPPPSARLEPNVPHDGVVPPGSVKVCDPLLIPKGTEMVTLELIGTFEVSFFSRPVRGETLPKAVCSVFSPTAIALTLSASLFPRGYAYIALRNPGLDTTSYTFTAWLLPTITTITPPTTITGRMDRPTDTVCSRLRTSTGYISLIQYKMVVPETASAVLLTLSSPDGKPLKGWLRFNTPVALEAEDVQADLFFTGTLRLARPLLKTGEYFIAFETVDFPQAFSLTVEVK